MQYLGTQELRYVRSLLQAYKDACANTNRAERVFESVAYLEAGSGSTVARKALRALARCSTLEMSAFDRFNAACARFRVRAVDRKAMLNSIRK